MANCIICGKVISPDHRCLGGPDGYICMKHEAEEVEVFSIKVEGDKSTLYEKEADDVLSLIENMDEGSFYTIGKKTMNSVKFHTLPEFQGF